MKTPLIAVCAAVLVVSGCASTESSTKDTPDAATPTATKASKSGGAKPKATATPKPEKAGIGDSITLSGFEGLKMRVKVLRLRDPIQGGEYEQPASGRRYIGVEIQMTNVSNKTYKDSPGNGATVIYGDDRQATATLMIGGACRSDAFASDTRIASGAKRRGCIAFEIPKSRKAKLFQFALESGFADEGGEWQLRR